MPATYNKRTTTPMDLNDPLELSLAIALCAIAWAVPVLWLFVGPLLFANVAFAWIFGGRP